MPSKRFLYTAAPLAILALAGMGLATAQSSSPFASKNRAQAWEQQPVQSQAWQTQPAQNQAWQPQAAPRQSAVPQSAPVELVPPPRPSFSASPSVSQPAPAAPIYQSSSTATPPKTYGGQPAAPYRAPAQNYAPQQLAGAVTPPNTQPRAQSSAQAPVQTSPQRSASPTAPRQGYRYTPPQPRQYAQAPNLGTPAPPQTAPQSAGSPFAPRSGQRPQAWEIPQQPQYQPQTSQQPAPQYQAQQNFPPQGVPPQGIPPQGIPPQGVPPQGFPPQTGPFTPPPQQKRSLKDRFGLGSIATVLRGAFTAGAAASFRETPDVDFSPDDGTSEDFIGDAELELEVSAVTQGGLEYGFTLGGRAQYDPFRRGFGGRLPDCPPTVVGCSGQTLGLTSGLRGHTSGFYSIGEDIAQDFQGNLESAHLFLRSAYGDVTIGRDDGAAYLFSLGAPSLLAVGASNSPVDYTGLDSVKTVNDASGFSEKITYTSPRLLGDEIGVGVQLGLSYALDADVCGVDYCNGRNIDGVIQPEIEDVFEVGLALDRTFDNGIGVELTGTYARGSEASGLAGLDDLDSFGAGLEFTYSDWTLGGSFLQSNNGLLDGDYTAYDVGATWQPSVLGFTLGYGHAEDDNIGLTSDQATLGVTYEFDKFTLGTGVQLVDREVDGLDELGAFTSIDQRAASVFVQGGFKF